MSGIYQDIVQNQTSPQQNNMAVKKDNLSAINSQYRQNILLVCYEKKNLQKKTKYKHPSNQAYVLINKYI